MAKRSIKRTGGRFDTWDDFRLSYDKRLDKLQYFRVTAPYGFFQDTNQGEELHKEGVYSYLFGLPNASVVNILRCLEIGLGLKYKKIEKAKAPDLSKLIDWGDQFLGNKKEIAHGFRLLRNLVHSGTLVREQDALEAIRHISDILVMIYPFERICVEVTCLECGSTYPVKIAKQLCYLGNRVELTTTCPSCHKERKRKTRIWPLLPMVAEGDRMG